MIIMHFINFLCVCLVEGERRRRLLRGRLSTVASHEERLGGRGRRGGEEERERCYAGEEVGVRGVY